MRKNLTIICLVVSAIGLAFGYWFIASRATAGKYVAPVGEDPDMPKAFQTAKGDKRAFMQRRAEYIGLKRGIDKDKPLPDPHLRQDGIALLERQQAALADLPDSSEKDAITAAWTEIGPNPIPNGQVISGTPLPVSGRTISIAVDPTNANTVYVGTAQGGLFRSLNGGTTWTPLMDNALSLAIGAITVSPSQPGTVYVGTGEPNFSNDSFFGVGVYRITNANTATPTVTGPLNRTAFNEDVFTGTSISEIAVDPTNVNNIFVTTTYGIGGIGSQLPGLIPPLGTFRSTNAAQAVPTFTQLSVPVSSFYHNFTDVVIDPGNPNRVIVATGDKFFGGDSGIYLSTNALAANPTFTLTQALFTTDRTELAINRVGTVTTVYAATGRDDGQVLRSVDGGATWTQRIDNNFCSPQCFYDVAIAASPTVSGTVYLGGGPNFVFGSSIDGGASFTKSEGGLHSDTQAIAVAPNSPATIYFGSDGGIYKSINSGASWTSLNNTTFRATQFIGLAVHSTDPNFTIGGTQDNGTNMYRANATWNRVDFGDGGYAVIDQADTSTTDVDMYHTYFNGGTLKGYGHVPSTALAQEGSWTFRGCNEAAGNGISCDGDVLFYAPLEQGPGTPNNSIYYASDRLYRSADKGVNHTQVSQILTSAVSAIGISPQNDNVRIVGQQDGGIYGTSTGANILINLDPTNVVPNDFIGRTVIDPNNVNTAYVTLAVFGITNVYKSTNINALTDNLAPTWTAAAGSGANVLPQVPVNAFIVDPLNSTRLYAGTDIGVYYSIDGGVNWKPFGTGLPRVAVFDIAITPNRLVRIATHGRGMWQIAAVAPTAASVTVGGRVTAFGRGLSRAVVKLTDANGDTRTIATNNLGYYRFADVSAGQDVTIEVFSKQYSFEPQLLTVRESVENFDFNAIK